MSEGFLIEITLLLDRLEDFENCMTSEVDAREWHGHVSPVISRIKGLALRQKKANKANRCLERKFGETA